MIKAERWETIEKHLETAGYASVSELMSLTDSSRATTRRDLDSLAEAGRLSLTHGGAVSIFQKAPIEGSYEEKIVSNADEKDRIARLAASMIKPGDKVFVDSGTTTFKIVPYLSKIENLTVITNDVNIASRLYNMSNISMVILGGVVRPGYCSIIGYSAEMQAKEMNADICFVGTDYINEKGIYISNLDEVGIKTSIMSNSSKIVVLCDHSKMGLEGFARINTLENLDMVITGKESLKNPKTAKMETKCKFMFA